MLTLSVGFYFFRNICHAESHLIINEIQITGGAGKTAHDFIELYNPTGHPISLKGYRLVKRTKTGTADTTIKSWTSDAIVQKNDYYLWANSADGFAESLGADVSTAQTISNDNAIALRHGPEDTGEIIDSVAWGNNQSALIENLPYPQNPGANKSIGRNGFEDTDDNSLDFFLLDSPTPTPSSPPPPEDGDGDEDEDEDESKDDSKDSPDSGKCSDDIRLNEFLPNPKDESQEYIELHNTGDSDEDISDWVLRDSSKNGKYAFPKNTKIKGKGFMVVYKKDFKFSLSNSSDSVRLFCPDQKEIESVEYKSAKEEISYNAAGDGAWSWSKHQTPGAENKLEKVPRLKIKVPKHVYVGMYAQFEAEIKNRKDYKFRWDFKDKHKSYLEDPRHEFEKKGVFAITLTAKGKSQDIETMKKIRVEEFPEEKVEIVSLCPNPKGKDTGAEWIEIKNSTKKKIDMTGWSIATGTKGKKMINHPIYQKITLKPGEAKKIDHTASRFYLNNKEAELELRYPNGETASRLAYDHEETAAEEDEIYLKTGKKWAWVALDNDAPPDSVSEKQTNAIASASIPKKENEPIKEKILPGFSPRTVPNIVPAIFMKSFRTKLAGYATALPENPPAGHALINTGNCYAFTSPETKRHWVVVFLDRLTKYTNKCLHRIWNL